MILLCMKHDPPEEVRTSADHDHGDMGLIWAGDPNAMVDTKTGKPMVYKPLPANREGE